MSKKPTLKLKEALAPLEQWLDKSGVRARLEPHLAQYRAMDSEKKKQLHTALIFCVIAANLLLIFAPMLSRTMETLQKIQKIKGETGLAAKDIASQDQTLKTKTILEEALAKTSTRIFELDQVHRFLDVLSDMAQESHVSIESLTPISVKSMREDLPYPMPKGYGTAGFELIGAAGFHELGGLISRLEASEKFVRVEALEVLHEPESERRVHQVTVRLIVLTRG